MKKQTANRRNRMNTQAACRTAYAANASGTMIAKIAGISTAAVLAVSIPVILHNVNSSKTEAGRAASVSQKNEISGTKSDKHELADQTMSEIETVTSAYETSEGETPARTDMTDDSSAPERLQEKTTREANLEAIDGSHIFSVNGNEMSFDDLYKMGCANASDEIDGLAMAMIGEHGGMSKVYHTVFYTTDDGNEWKQLDGFLTVPTDNLQYFALDNGDILVFRYGGARPAPTIRIFTQSNEDPMPRLSDDEPILEGSVLDDGYTISNEYAPYEFKASYNGGNYLHIDVSNDSCVNVGSFDIDINDRTYTFRTNDEPAPAEAESTETKTETANVDMSVEKLLSTDVDTLLAMSNNDYEFVQVQGQCEKYGFKCAAFPNYVFTVAQEYADGKAEGPFDVQPNYEPESHHINVYGKKIDQVDLLEGAYIGEGVTVGMTYNEIKEAVGGELKVHINNSSMGYSADVEINGRSWMLHFDLTEEQQNEVRSRIVDATPEENTCLWDTFVDISDMDPVCDMAVAFLY